MTASQATHDREQVDASGRITELDGVELEHSNVVTNDVRLHVVEAGPEDGDPVILLHGFPEFWYGWRNQIPALAEAGHRVVVPDQRGYNTSEKPHGIEPYHLDTLVDDVVGLVEEQGHEQLPILAHDWGAIVGWHMATTRPEHVERLVNINVPHLAVYDDVMPGDIRQVLKSWYVFFFQIPWLPERLATVDDFSPGEAALRDSRPGAFTDAEIEHYKEAWSRPGAVESMINWYRALVQLDPDTSGSPRVEVPTLLLWGVDDSALRRTLAQPSIDLCDDGQLVFFEECTHWVQHEEPDRVNDYVTDFFAGREVRE